MAPLHDRKIGPAAHALGRLNVRNPNRRPVALHVAATRDCRVRLAHARDPAQIRRQLIRVCPVFVFVAVSLVLVQMEVDVRVEERLLRQYVGVDGKLVVADNVALGGVVFDRTVVDRGFGRRVRRVHEEDGLQDVAQVAGEVRLELVCDARDADEQAMDEIFA